MTGAAAGPRRTLAAPPAWVELARTPTALFLDVDGTLVDFASRPEHVEATEGLVSLLRAAADRVGGALALISGRPLADLDRIFAPWQPYAAGVHGAFVRGPQGVRRHHPDPAALAELRHRADQVAELFPGAWVEDKQVGVAIHYRAVPGAEPQLRALVDRLAADVSDHFVLQPGHLVQELRPVGWTKGTALHELMASAPFHGRLPVVAGDDLTDEYAFAASVELGGFGIVVGDRSDTAASYRLDDPAAVRGWLAELLEEVQR
jgi:trehalose 6-phosphate phosphatase